MQADLDEREMGMVMGALSSQLRYARRLAANNRDEEAAGRNRLWALRLKLLMEKLKGE
jgi:hypothetical protein